MLPAVRLPLVVSGGTNEEILNPSTMMYLRETTPENPFHALTIPVPVLRFVEIMRSMDTRGARILHASDTSRRAMQLVREHDEVSGDATLVFSDASLYETLRLAQSQRLGSTLVVVVGELVKRSEVQLLYLMCGMYRTVRLQALTVSHADQERLVIATDLLHRAEMSEPPYEFEMSRFFLTKLDELNSMHGQVRLELARTPHRDKTAAWLAMFLPENVA
jgi:hypothetical protein